MAEVPEIVVVAHPDEVAYCQEHLLDKYQFSKASVVPGGVTRQDSIQAGLAALKTQAAYVAVHDGARPLINPKLVRRVYQKAIKHGAAIPAARASNTMKVIDENAFVIETLDRSTLISVQTPQIFNYAQLLQAYERAANDKFVVTDDASLYEKYVGRVKAVIANDPNLKITIPEDITIAEQLIIKRGEDN